MKNLTLGPVWTLAPQSFEMGSSLRDWLGHVTEVMGQPYLDRVHGDEGTDNVSLGSSSPAAIPSPRRDKAGHWPREELSHGCAGMLLAFISWLEWAVRQSMDRQLQGVVGLSG